MKNHELIKIIESTTISIASSFPVLSSIATGWNEYKNHVQTKNIKCIIETFYNQLNQLNDRVNHQYLGSDNLKSLIIKTCFYGKEEMSKEKRKMLSYYLANSCTNEHYKDVSKNSILETIIKLSGFDVSIIKYIADISKDGQNSILSGTKKYDPNSTGWVSVNELKIIEDNSAHNDRDILMTLEYLNSAGVIENRSVRFSNINFNLDIETYLRNKEFSEIQKKIKSFNNSNSVTINHLEIAKLHDHLKNLPKPEIVDRDNQKSYTITALGLAVLSYLKE